MRPLKIIPSITSRENASLDKYLQEIGKVFLITAEEEVILAQKIRNGDQGALEKLTKANLRFVVSVAKQYQGQGLSLPDLINEGNFGLIKAAKRFDETRGFKFISYAVWWIRKSILAALRVKRGVYTPSNRGGDNNKYLKMKKKLRPEFEGEPPKYDIAEALALQDLKAPQDNLEYKPTEGEFDAAVEWWMKRIEELEDMYRRQTPSSLDGPFVEGSNNALLDVLGNNNSPYPDAHLEQQDSNLTDKELARVLKTLTDREEDVLIKYFGLFGTQKMTLQKIGIEMGRMRGREYTREYIRQIKEKGLRRMRQKPRSKLLRFLSIKGSNKLKVTDKHQQQKNTQKEITKCFKQEEPAVSIGTQTMPPKDIGMVYLKFDPQDLDVTKAMTTMEEIIIFLKTIIIDKKGFFKHAFIQDAEFKMPHNEIFATLIKEYGGRIDWGLINKEMIDEFINGDTIENINKRRDIRTHPRRCIDNAYRAICKVIIHEHSTK